MENYLTEKGKYNMQEAWKTIDGYERYQISNTGKVVSDKRQGSKGGEINPTKNEFGYLQVKLYKDGAGKYNNFAVHRLVASAFIDNPYNLPEVNHKDGDKNNNNVENLEWVTRQENVKHSFETGLNAPHCGEENGNHKLTQNDVDEIRKIYIKGDELFGGAALAKEYGVSVSTICRIARNEIWKVEN